jgi:hypothetical protein
LLTQAVHPSFCHAADTVETGETFAAPKGKVIPAAVAVPARLADVEHTTIYATAQRAGNVFVGSALRPHKESFRAQGKEKGLDYRAAFSGSAPGGAREHKRDNQTLVLTG